MSVKETIIEKKDDVIEAAGDFVDEHFQGLIYAAYGVGVAVSIPLCYALYKWYGGVMGKACAKELVKSGVFNR